MMIINSSTVVNGKISNDKKDKKVHEKTSDLVF